MHWFCQAIFVYKILYFRLPITHSDIDLYPEKTLVFLIDPIVCVILMVITYVLIHTLKYICMCVYFIVLQYSFFLNKLLIIP